jgi:hypothetical protein
LAGLVQGILTLFAVLKFLKQYSRNYNLARKILVVVLPLGTLPFLLILNRPEQLILLLFLTSANLSKTFTQSFGWPAKVLIGLVQGLLVVSIPAIHPKGLLFSFIAVLIFLVQNLKSSKAFSSLLILTSLISAKVSSQVWTLRTECPQSEFISQTFKNITINPAKMDASTPSMVFGNVLRTPKYLFHILYQQNYQSNWLSMKSEIPIVLLGLANIGVVIVIILLLQSLYQDLAPLRLKPRSLDLSGMISCIFIGSIILLAVLQRTKNFYDSYIPAMLLMLAVALTIEKDLSYNFKNFEIRKILSILILPGLIFTLFFAGTNDSTPGKEIRKQLIEQCLLSRNDMKMGRFVLDPSLTRIFWDSPNFIYASYIWGWWGQDIDAEKVLKNFNPSVLIIREDRKLGSSSHVIKVGDFYCSRPNDNKLK